MAFFFFSSSRYSSSNGYEYLLIRRIKFYKAFYLAIYWKICNCRRRKLDFTNIWRCNSSRFTYCNYNLFVKQGIFGFVQNLGSLVARIAFLSIERAGFLLFTRLKDDVKERSKVWKLLLNISFLIRFFIILRWNFNFIAFFIFPLVLLISTW